MGWKTLKLYLPWRKAHKNNKENEFADRLTKEGANDELIRPEFNCSLIQHKGKIIDLLESFRKTI